MIQPDRIAESGVTRQFAKPKVKDWLKILPPSPLRDSLIQREREKKKKRPIIPGKGPGISPTKEKKSPGGKVRPNPPSQ